MHLIRTNSENPEFIKLVKQLDKELAVRDGADHGFYAQYNKIDLIKHVVVAYQDEVAVACGALKEYDKNTMEVKRMFTSSNHRGMGFALNVLSELEKWAKELSYKKCVLETGLKQPEAIGLYLKSGYVQMPNYGQYVGVETSRCFEKSI